MASEELTNYLENGNIINSVNFPRLDLGKRDGVRLVVLYEANKEAELKKIVNDNVVSKAFVSGIKGNFGASLFEIEKAFDLELIKPYCLKARLLVD